MAATLGQRIQDIVGFDYASNSINSEDEALEVACAEVIDLTPVSLLLKYAVAPTDLVDGAATMNIEGKKVLRVIRFYLCKLNLFLKKCNRNINTQNTKYHLDSIEIEWIVWTI